MSADRGNTEELPLNTSAVSPWSPFRSRQFAVLWTVTVVSNIGTWMHDVGASWLMTSLSPSPLMVSLVQTATTLPIFLFALPAGALADIVDRRFLLIVLQTAMASLALVFTLLVVTASVTPSILLVFTFLLGSCAAFIAPAWQAIVPALVNKESLQAAIALNGVGINVSRAIGPALAGLLIASIGIFSPFALNVISFVGVIAALFWWRQPALVSTSLPAERLLAAMSLGLRYARNSAPLQMALIRAAAFFLFASAFWSLLPLLVRNQLRGGPADYGLLLGCIGLGAVSGALIMPALRKRLSPDRMVMTGTTVAAITLFIAANARTNLLMGAASLLFGMGWIAVLSTLNTAVQTAIPNWVRARGLSIYLMVFFGAMSAGSVLWGIVANVTSLGAALIIAAVGALFAIALTRRAHLPRTEEFDLAPSAHWPAPMVALEDINDRGPVLITIAYRIRAADKEAFLSAIKQLERARRRAGAYAWGVMQDAADPESFIEYFFETCWFQHLRHHERVSGDDRFVQDRINSFHADASPPAVRHLLQPQ